MKFCHQCGYQLNDNVQFCPRCGAPQQMMNNQGSQYSNPTQNQYTDVVQLPENVVNYKNTESNKKTGCGTILLWIFFLPIMLWIHALKKKQVGWFILAVLVTLFTIGYASTSRYSSNSRSSSYDYNRSVSLSVTKTPKPTSTPTPTPDPSLYKKIDYIDCARYPEKYDGVKARFEGTVVQVTGSRTRGFTVRLATSGSFDDIIYLSVNKDPGFNILEDDKLTVYVVMTGTKTYTSVLGSSITLPSARADIVELITK